MNATYPSRVLVLGGAGGIGSAACADAAARGAQVWVCDRVDGQSTAQGLSGAGHRAITVDSTDAAAVDALVGEAWRDGETLGFIYAVGIQGGGPVADIVWSDYQRVMAANLEGAMLLGRAIHQALVRDPRQASVVYISSVAGLHGGSGGSLYCTSKFAMIGFAQSFAADVALLNCRVNVVCPGNVDTSMMGYLAKELVRRHGFDEGAALDVLRNETAFQRLLTPAEVAKTCSFLLSDAASGISGQTIVVDGPRPAL